MYRSNFTLKIIILSTLPILLFSIFSVVVLFYKIKDLNNSTSLLAGNTFNDIYMSLMRDKSSSIKEKILLKLQPIFNELDVLRAGAQKLIDKDQIEHDLWNQNRFIYNLEKKWSNLAKNENNISMSVWGYLHNEDGSINQKTKDYIVLMSPIKMLMQNIGEFGSEKGWYYITGPKETPVMIMTPWAQMPEIFDNKYPGHNKNNWWDFFFPGIVESWNKWVVNSDLAKGKIRNEVTWIPLYEDAGGTGLMITFFAPLWNKKRTENFGAAAVDYNINKIINIVKNEKIGEKGSTFIVQSDGSTLGLSNNMIEQLELPHYISRESGVDISQYNLRNSKIKEISTIAQKINENSRFITSHFIDKNRQRFLLSFENLMNFNLWSGKNGTISNDSLYIATIVPEQEIYAAQSKIRNEISLLSYDALLFLILASCFFASLSILFAGWYALQYTAQIRKMSEGVKALSEKDYSVSVDIVAKDDLGALADSFNTMIREVANAYNKLENYTHDLEDKVKERTVHLEEANRKLEKLSQIDGLTKISNRRYFDIKLDEIWKEYSRLEHPISIILIDIDYFKKYNDTYGHQAGDTCLCSVADALKNEAKRVSDIVARYGGEEFVVITCTDLDCAFELAEKMRLAVQSLSIEHKLSDKKIISISLGVASTIPSWDQSISSLVEKADQALYESKESGRNKTSKSHNA